MWFFVGYDLLWVCVLLGMVLLNLFFLHWAWICLGGECVCVFGSGVYFLLLCVCVVFVCLFDFGLYVGLVGYLCVDVWFVLCVVLLVF